MRKRRTATPKELKTWLLTRKRGGATFAELGAMLDISRGHACLLASGKAEPTQALLQRFAREWLVSKTHMRRNLPRLVRALRARYVDTTKAERVYGRGGRPIKW